MFCKLRTNKPGSAPDRAATCTRSARDVEMKRAAAVHRRKRSRAPTTVHDQPDAAQQARRRRAAGLEASSPDDRHDPKRVPVAHALRDDLRGSSNGERARARRRRCPARHARRRRAPLRPPPGDPGVEGRRGPRSPDRAGTSPAVGRTSRRAKRRAPAIAEPPPPRSPPRNGDMSHYPPGASSEAYSKTETRTGCTRWPVHCPIPWRGGVGCIKGSRRDMSAVGRRHARGLRGRPITEGLQVGTAGITDRTPRPTRCRREHYLRAETPPSGSWCQGHAVERSSTHRP